MANIKTIEEIIKAFSSGGNKKIISLLEKEAKVQRARGRVVVAKRLTNLIKDIPNTKQGLSGQSITPRPLTINDNDALFEKHYPDVDLDTVVLNSVAKGPVIEFLKHWEAVDKLLENNITPANKILFYGPPGTGKTKLACAIANKLQLPLIIIKLDELVSSYLGKTGKNISRVFEIAKNKQVVLFFDEIDTVAKHRDDSRELGELKRVVTVLLQNIDTFTNSSILIGATNHERILDKALWRRFDLRLEINLPDEKSRTLLFELFLDDAKKKKKLDYQLMAKVTHGINGSLIRDICQNIQRNSVIENVPVDDVLCLKHIISFNHQLEEQYRLDKKNLYYIAQILKKNGYNLMDISEASGVPYTTLRDNINKTL